MFASDGKLDSILSTLSDYHLLCLFGQRELTNRNLLNLDNFSYLCLLVSTVPKIGI